MQTAISSRNVQGIAAAPNTAFLDLPLVPAAARKRCAARRRSSRSLGWYLASVLSLLASSAAYAVYALLHMGA